MNNTMWSVDIQGNFEVLDTTKEHSVLVLKSPAIEELNEEMSMLVPMVNPETDLCIGIVQIIEDKEKAT